MTFGRAAILAAAIAVALPGAALAQDAAFNWSGAYVGAQVGYGIGQTASGPTHLYQEVDPLNEYTEISPLAPFTYSGTGVVGGGEAGYNWQTGNLVIGVVGDISATNIRGTYEGSTAFSIDSTLNWLGTARVNVGVPIGNTLFYGTGGLAFGGVTANLHDYYDDGATVIDSSANSTSVGWTVGAGVAAAINSHWIAKAEFLYADLGTHDVAFQEVPVGDFGFPLITSSAKTTASILKFSIDYKF